MTSIDVVVPCYGYGRYLEQCVRSVLDQGVADLRVLILDDASPDDTPEVALALTRLDPRVTYRRHAANCGHIRTYNEGIDWLAADFMLLLSADDHLLPGALPRALALMAGWPEIGLCIGDAIALQEGPGERRTPLRVPLKTVGQADVVLSGREFIELCIANGSNNIVPTPTAVVRTALLRQVGGYRPELTHSGDLELWLRLAARASVGIVRTPQAVYRRHTANMSSTYHQDHCLADLAQRKAAFDEFRAACRHLLPDVDGLYHRLLGPLALAAVGHASSAFNHGRLALSQRLCAFALAADPRVRRSRAWSRLQYKQLIGVRLTRLLLGAARRLPGRGRPRPARGEAVR